MGSNQQISKLVQALKINDERKASEYEELPEAPRDAMDALVGIGNPAVEALLGLLKDASVYSCLYAVQVLGEIGDPRAIQPIIDVLSSEVFADTFWLKDEHDQPIVALQKLGLLALEPTMDFLERKKKEDDEAGMCNAMEILAGIKNERSFLTLVDMLSHSSEEVQSTAIMLLGEYGDRRAVEHLEKLLENAETREEVAEALRRLISPRQYRQVMEPYTQEYLESLKREMDSCLGI